MSIETAIEQRYSSTFQPYIMNINKQSKIQWGLLTFYFLMEYCYLQIISSNLNLFNEGLKSI